MYIFVYQLYLKAGERRQGEKRREGQFVLWEKSDLKSKVGSPSSMQTGTVPKAAMSVKPPLLF